MKRHPPLATLALTATILVAYAAELASGDVQGFCLSHGLDPSRPSFETALGSLFLHASPAHLGANLVVLLFAGIAVERVVGSARFAALFFAAGVAGCALHVVADPGSILVGCSGAIAGVVTVLGALRPRLIGFALGFVGWNVWLALSGDTGSASFGAHLGGAFAGVAFVALSRLRGRVLELA